MPKEQIELKEMFSPKPRFFSYVLKTGICEKLEA
jgi:hypothetical protein